MNRKEILHKYYKKLVKEALFKSTLCGVIIGAFVGAIVMAISWISKVNEWTASFNGTWIAVGVTLSVSLAATIGFYFIVFRPTMKKAAERVDLLGYEERAITMLQMADSNEPMALIQREDVNVRLNAPTSRKLKIKIPKLIAITACVLLAVTLTTLIVPNATGVFAVTEIPGQADQAIIDELLKDLREEINESTVNQGVKDDMHEIVDNLKESLKDLTSTQEKIDKILETAEEIRDKLNNWQTHDKLGEALKEFENTKDLGDAIQKSDTDKVKDALDEIKDKIDSAASGEDMKDELNDLASSIDQALDKAGKEGDPLSDALKDLSDQLKDAASDAENGDMENASQKTDSAISDAKESISNALGEENSQSNLNDQMQGSIGEALDKLDPNGSMHEDSNGNENSSSQEGSAGKSEEDAPPSDKPGQSETEDPEQTGAPNPEDDPYGSSYKDGKTPYTENFEKYFREEMAKLENSDATQEERETIARYFAAMRVKEDSDDTEK